MKSFKKVLATTLAAAMVVTAVPITPANAAAAPKLNATKKTYYAGKTYKSLKVTIPKSWKKVKVTSKSSKKSVATVKTSKKTITVKAVKAGKTTVTVKVTGKNSKGKKLSKSLKCTVTVKTPSLSVSASNTTLQVGDTATIKAAKKPSTASVTYASSNTAVATVGKTNGKVTAVSAGAVTITASMKVGTKTVKKTIKFTVSEAVAKEDGITTELVSHIEGQNHAVLVGSVATVRVKVAKNGTPVKNKQVIFTATQAAGGTNAQYEVLSGNAAVTDNNGVATFVIGNKKSVTTITDKDAIAEVKYTASLADGSASAKTDVVDFAAVNYGDLTYENDTTAKKVRFPGTNYADVNGAKDGSASTKSVNGNSNVWFAASQQTSATGTSEHALTFSATPSLVIPASASTDKTALFTQPINKASGKFHTYDNIVEIVQMEKDMNTLDYATLYIKNIQISKYCEMQVSAYDTEVNAKAGGATGRIGDVQTLEGEKEQASFGYQIPKNKNVKFIRVAVVAKGQVNTAKNNGFELDRIDGMYKTQVSGGTTTVLGGVNIKWQKDEVITYSEDKKLENAEAAKLGIPDANNAATKKDYRYVYQVPTFPQAGNAIIREYDANNKLKAYYAVPSVNMKRYTTGTNFEYINENDIFEFKTTNNQVDRATLVTTTKAFLITEHEARNVVGTVTQDGNKVTVNSTDEGTTKVVGKVEIAGDDSSVAVENQNIYTSVLWSPLPKDSTVTSNNGAFVAIKGQSVKVYAQLTDKNGHPVAQSGINVEFSYKGSNKIPQGSSTLNSLNKRVKATSQSTATDPNGRSELILQSADVDTLVDLAVAVTGANSGRYDAKLSIKDKVTDKADIYWADATLSYIPSANGSAALTKTYTSADTDIPTSEPQVGETWEYGVIVGSKALVDGKLAGAVATINGLKTKFTATGMTDTVTVTAVEGKSAANVKSTKGGLTRLKAALDTSALNENATVTVKKGDVTLDATYAGTGSVNIFDTLTIPVQWVSTGVTANYVSPYGSMAAEATRDVYLKVVDNHGNAIDNKDVTFTAQNGATFVTTGAGITVVTDGAVKVKTNGDGIAKVTVNRPGNITTYPSSIITAAVEGVTETFSTTINWRNKQAALKAVQAVYSQGTPDTIEVTFNRDIFAGSVNAKEFKVTVRDNAAPNDDSKAKKLTVAKAEVVNGNKVKLTLAGNNVLDGKTETLRVEVEDATVNSVVYTLTSENGESVVSGDSIDFSSDADYDLSVTKTSHTISVTVTPAASGNAYAVSENGVVTSITVTAGSGSETVSDAGYYKVYFGNAVKDLTVE